MIYQGTAANTTGANTQIQTNTFSINNSAYNNNAYVGYMYTLNEVHGLGTNSGIKTVIDQWYQNNLTSVADKIDGNAGFCGDREPSTSNTTSNGSGGTGSTQTYYGGYIRLRTNKAPMFECKNDSDLYTTGGSEQGNQALQYPIGLITADEVAYAGGVVGSSNQSYYLYTGQAYWTMSPCSLNYAYAYVFYVDSTSNLTYNDYVGEAAYGVRPVINLRSDVTISSGNGTASQPYVISS